MEKMVHRSKEEQMLKKHFEDLSRMAYLRGFPFFSDFTGLTERDLIDQAVKAQFPSLPSMAVTTTGIPVAFYGGYPDAERVIAAFLPEAAYPPPAPEEYPLCCIRIKPVNRRFSEELTHRDYLGTVMGLGLERDQIGDIVIRHEGNTGAEFVVAYVFCKQDKAELLLGLNRIRHTTVTAEQTEVSETLHWTPEYKDISGSVSSLRLDAVLAIAIRTSRTQSLHMIRDGNIYINGRCCMENAKLLKDGDILSVRGHGKYLFRHNGAVSKKGRYQITVKQYI